MPPALLSLDPIPTLLNRLRAELSADFGPGRPLRVSRAPGRLDVMGGIADYSGSMVCEFPLDRAAAVAVSARDDRDLQVFSFNLLDDHKPFTFRIPLDALAAHPPEVLRREFGQPGRKWAAYVAGCLVALHVHHRVLDEPRQGINVALYSTVPPGAGVSSSAAIEVATMMALCDHLPVRGRRSGEDVAALCQWAENHVAGAPCGIMDQMTSCLGQEGRLLRMVCQPHELLLPLPLPPGVRVLGIDTGVRHSVGDGGAYARTRCAAFMGHRIILERMRDIGRAAGRVLERDPMNGYLANLDPDDYKNLFRPHVPESIGGQAFLDRYGPTIDPVTRVEPDVGYTVRHATDHHVLEARRVRRFCEFMERAASLTGPARNTELDRAGHLMYASHLSYTNDAMLGAPEADLLVRLVRDCEHAGLYGAKITGGGNGGTVAVLCNEGDRAGAALAEVMAEYEQQSGRTPQLFSGSSPGAWHVGTALVQGDL